MGYWKFGNFDPYKDDRERKAREKIEEIKSYKHNCINARQALNDDPERRLVATVRSSQTRRKNIPVTLPTLNLKPLPDDFE